jgi:hypothetical protein
MLSQLPESLPMTTGVAAAGNRPKAACTSSKLLGLETAFAKRRFLASA